MQPLAPDTPTTLPFAPPPRDERLETLEMKVMNLEQRVQRIEDRIGRVESALVNIAPRKTKRGSKQTK